MFLTLWFQLALAVASPGAEGSTLLAGAAKVDITHPGTVSTRDRLQARALVLRSGQTTAVLVAVDAVAIGGIGPIGNDYLGKVRGSLKKELGIDPGSVIVNASHCHGTVCADVAEKTVEAVRKAHAGLRPVLASAGTGREERIQENRRLRLKDGRETDVRHAYPVAPDSEIVGSGPIDPDIGLLRLDEPDGKPVAVVFHFACHPIMGLPDGSNTADLSGFASRTIEDSLGCTALFLQGCGGDINPIRYKDTTQPRDAEILGVMLGASALKKLRTLRGKADEPLQVVNERIEMPRADMTRAIARMEEEKEALVASLQGTSLDLKQFLELSARHGFAPDFPSAPAHQYQHEERLGRADLKHLDAANRKNLQSYLANIRAMEQLTRVQTNLALLRRHQKDNQGAGMRPVPAQLMGLRVGDFTLVTFPGELVAQIGLNLKKAVGKPNHHVSGYTNGYLFYCPTASQLKNRGGAQEDSDCFLAPEWQALFETTAREMFGRLHQ